MSERESVNVLQECIELQLRKSRDYQNPNSNVVQAMHYRRGIDSIHDIMHGKMLRAQSLLESGTNPNFESLEDTYKDLINYASFAVAWLRGKMEGQNPNLDAFNKLKIISEEFTLSDFGMNSNLEREDQITVAAIASGLNPDDPNIRTYVDEKLPE